MSKRSDFLSRKHETMDTYKDPLLGKYAFSRIRGNEINHKENKKRKARAKRKATGK